MANSMTNMRRSNRPCMVAMVLGTALTTFSPALACPPPASETTLRAIADINRYCTTCWRNARLPATAWNDCTQEVFTRLLERLSEESWTQVLARDGEERREFLRAIDAVKKRVQRARKYTGSLEGVTDQRETETRQIAEQRELVRQTAEEVLTPRQQRILQLSFEGWSVQEMAEEMQIPAERVSDEKYKAIRKLRGHLAGEEEGQSRQPSRLPA